MRESNDEKQSEHRADHAVLQMATRIDRRRFAIVPEEGAIGLRDIGMMASLPIVVRQWLRSDRGAL